MQLQLLLGRAGCGKSQHILSQIAKGSGKRVLIVPQQGTHQAEQALSRAMGGGFLGVEVFSLTRLAHRVLLECGQFHQAFIDAQGKALMMARVLEQEKEHLPTLGRAAHWPGFARLAAELAAEMKKYSVSPDMLFSAAQGTLPKRMASRAQEVAHILTAYDKAMQGHFIDGEDAMEAMISLLPQSGLLTDAAVYIDGFDAFTPQIRRAVEVMMGQARSLTVALTDDPNAPDADLFAVERYYAQQLTAAAQRLGIPVTRTMLEGAPQRTPTLAHLERSVFCLPPTPYKQPPQGLCLWVCTDEAQQAERTAQDIAHRLREENLRCRDIGIVLPPDGGGELIARALNRCGIAHFLDEKRTLLHHPLCELLRAALSAVGSGWRQAAVLRVMKTGLAGLTANQADRLENHALAIGLNRSAWLRPVQRVMPGENQAELEQLREKLMSPLKNLAARMKNGGTGLVLSSALYAYLTEVDALRKSLEEAESLAIAPGDEALSRAAQEAKQAAGVVVQLLDQLAATAGEQFLSPSDFSRLVDAGLHSRTLGVIPTTLDQVLIGPAERVAAAHPKAVYVLSLTDDAWSAPPDTALLGGDDRVQLELAGIRLGRSAEFRRQESRLSLYRAFACARTQLTLSTVQMRGGRAATPALVLADVQRAFPMLRPAPMPTGEETLSKLMIQTPGGSWRYAITAGGDAARAALAWYRQHPPWAQALAAHGAPLPAQENTVPRVLGTSVSRLETFAACPYQYAAAYRLGAMSREVFTPSGDAAVVGSTLHAAMEALEARIAAQGGWERVTPDDAQQIAAAVAREKLADTPLLDHAEGKQVGEDILRLCRRTAEILHHHNRAGRYVPLGGEIAFGMDTPGALPAIALPYEGGEARLAGRIDRADVFESDEQKYVRIVDYKSSFTDESLGRIALGLELQLPLYLSAMCEALGASPAGFFHYRFDDPMERENAAAKTDMSGFVPADARALSAMDEAAAEAGVRSRIVPVTFKDETPSGNAALTPEDFAQLLRYARGHAGNLCTRIARGEAQPSPVQLDDRLRTCDRCIYRAACRFDPGIHGIRRVPGAAQARRMMNLSTDTKDQSEEAEE